MLEDQKIHGLSLQDCAEIIAKDGALKAQHGERHYKPYLHQYLATKGTNEQTYAHAWNAWHTRLESDPSGQLYAKFAAMQQAAMQRSHMADVPDMSADSKAGVSLESYAAIMAGISAGKDYTALLQEHGIDTAQWQRAQNAWTAAMAADVNHHITTQYGQLYAKYTPGFQQNMEAQTAATMSARYVERSMGLEQDEPEPEYEFEHMVADMQSATPRQRWMGAHHIMNRWDIAGESARAMPPLSTAIERAYGLAIEALEQSDEHTTSEAEALASDLLMLASEGYLNDLMASDATGAMQRCLGRAKERLWDLRAAFDPIADQAVPERVKMQSAIQDHEGLIETLQETLADWDETIVSNEHGDATDTRHDDSSPFPNATASETTSGPSTHPGASAASAQTVGFMATLRQLPVVGDVIRMLGL